MRAEQKHFLGASAYLGFTRARGYQITPNLARHGSAVNVPSVELALTPSAKGPAATRTWSRSIVGDG